MSNPAQGAVGAETRTGQRIWFDTEFYENGNTIELISIGMVREDGETFYAETLPAQALCHGDEWLRKNVLPHLKGGGMMRPAIAEQIKRFVGDKPEFWAYYADYDWVALCQLYGRMIDLPKGWPMFCRDVKQEAERLSVKLPKQATAEHDALADAQWTRDAWRLLQDAALASPRADSDERTAGDALKEACKPWEGCSGEPPEYESPLNDVFVAGMIYMERLLAKLLDVTHYEGGDGSEDFDRDATQTLGNILTGARLWDADENRPVSATPAQPKGGVRDGLKPEDLASLIQSIASIYTRNNGSITDIKGLSNRLSREIVEHIQARSAGAVPDSLRAAFEAAELHECWVNGDTADVMTNPYGHCGNFDQIVARCATGDLWRKRAVAIAESLNFVRTLLASHPAGQSEPPVLRAVVEVYPDRTDTRLTFGDRIRPEPGVKAVEQAVAALTAEYEARGGCPVVGRLPAGQSAGQRAGTVGLGWKLDDETKDYLRALDAATARPGDPRLNTMVGPAGPAAGMDRYGSQARPLKPAPDSPLTGPVGTEEALDAVATKALADELFTYANQLVRVETQAGLGGKDLSVRVKEPGWLADLMRRAASALHARRLAAAEASLATATSELARLRAALTEIRDHPEEHDDGQRSYAVKWAFWNIQNIARTALARAATAREGA